MHPCGNAGRQCPREATLTVRIAKVGDRHLCQECYDGLVALGMDIRILDPNAPLPAWRTRGLSRDLTGRVMA